MNFHDNSKNKNRKIDFSFVSAHCASFIKNRIKTEGGGPHILSWEKAYCPLKYYRIMYKMYASYISQGSRGKAPR